jgi:formate dehydrogenase subunit delta
MNVARLVAMANDIAAFFATEPDAVAAEAVAHHLTRYWERRMKRQIIDHQRAGGAGLSPIALAAVGLLAAREASLSSTPQQRT